MIIVNIIIKLRLSTCMSLICLQCFDIIGWAKFDDVALLSKSTFYNRLCEETTDKYQLAYGRISP